MKKRKLSNAIWSLILVALLGYTIYGFGFRFFNNFLINKNPTKTKAIIINDENYYPNQPVHPEFSYSYEFEIDGKKYKGDSHDISLNVGDTVDVIYYKYFPYFNKPLHPKD